MICAHRRGACGTLLSYSLFGNIVSVLKDSKAFVRLDFGERRVGSNRFQFEPKYKFVLTTKLSILSLAAQVYFKCSLSSMSLQVRFFPPQTLLLEGKDIHRWNTHFLLHGHPSVLRQLKPELKGSYIFVSLVTPERRNKRPFLFELRVPIQGKDTTACMLLRFQPVKDDFVTSYCMCNNHPPKRHRFEW